nr:MAG TPA: hypothetical protein [Caudoviricetes sp.]
MTAASFRVAFLHSGIAQPTSHFTFISRINDQSLADVLLHISDVLPHPWTLR